VRGESEAEFILRSPAVLQPDGSYRSLSIPRFTITLASGAAETRVTIKTGGDRQDLSLKPQDAQTVTLGAGPGLPYKPFPAEPTNFVYLMSVKSSGGFIPLFAEGSRDSRFLGVMVKIVPEYE
jgi:hypothetical protein